MVRAPRNVRDSRRRDQARFQDQGVGTHQSTYRSSLIGFYRAAPLNSGEAQSGGSVWPSAGHRLAHGGTIECESTVESVQLSP